MKSKYLFYCVFCVFLSGCANTNISKEMQLTAGGAAAGALAGAQVDGVRGAIIGGIIGGFIGNGIGSYLDEKDKEKLALLEMQSLQTGKATSFVSGKSKTKVTITPQQIKVEANPKRTFNVPSDVVKQRLEVASYEEVKAFVNTPIYRDTNEKSVPKQVVVMGDKVHVAANVINKQWGAVVDGENVLGYVPLRYLNKNIQKQANRTFAKVAPPKSTKALAVAKGGESKSSAIMPQAPTALAHANFTTSAVHPELTCKIILIRLIPSDGSKAVTEERKHCMEPPKGWRTVEAEMLSRARA